MSLENQIEAHIKRNYLTLKDNEGKQNTIDGWEKLSDETKEMFIHLIKTFPLLRDVVNLYDKQTEYTEIAFSRDMKLLIKQFLK